ncbi:MAG TPA: PIN domain nuclease [Mycobacteriales bacterium]|nr:PIN domain nuclease [Mycobacteriales bacterium]
MYLIDTSAWIEYLRKTGSPAGTLVRDLLQRSELVATTEPVVMELLAGAAQLDALGRLERTLDSLPLLSVDTVVDYRDAARIYRAARERGRTVRKLPDCLIAAVALRTDAVLVHDDADVDLIAECVGLKTLRAPGRRST